MIRRIWIRIAVSVGLFSLATVGWANTPSPASIEPARPEQCPPALQTCESFDALVFVHGIYGGNETFVNSSTGFDWTKEFPATVEGRRIDVYRLTYQTALLSWAKEKDPTFGEVAKAVLEAMKPLRTRQYRSIGFIAHSLGGNVVSTYIHMVKTKLGHPQRSQHAYVITLATPVLGSQIADMGAVLKAVLGMNDNLLDSLKKGNLYLEMLNEFRELEDAKEKRYVCRPVHLHAAYEEKYLGPVLVVSRDSAAESISKLAKSPVVGFRLNHSEIAKPSGPEHDVYRWVLDRVTEEFKRMATWEAAHRQSLPTMKLCEQMSFIPEL
jgi:hypothetical protein